MASTGRRSPSPYRAARYDPVTGARPRLPARDHVLAQPSETHMAEKIVLAYSGGLDTSVAAHWLRVERGYEVHGIIRLQQSAGSDLSVRVHNVNVATGEVVTRAITPAYYKALLANPLYKGIEKFVSADRSNDYNNLQPRFGVTYDVRGDGSLVARGATGLYITRNRPWLQQTTMDRTFGFAVRITDEQAGTERLVVVAEIRDSRAVDSPAGEAIEAALNQRRQALADAELEALVKRVQHCRLETHPHFFDIFVEGCQFSPIPDRLEVGAS